jgi:hypothetical protein
LAGVLPGGSGFAADGAAAARADGIGESAAVHTGVALPVPLSPTRYGSERESRARPAGDTLLGGTADMPLPWSRLGSYDIIHAGAAGCSHANRQIGTAPGVLVHG